ncbi:hypothetical protein NQ176_g2962 [Zarea fungicola]|uniref:Uncharacterized protein n=1 Tax=Zarea fungicola TaxID=93591 RepID=A0ACC1NNH3_9HYPO|nr:hypothetical protein NQ176_g2962 [Lecanicillium fungicola]
MATASTKTDRGLLAVEVVQELRKTENNHRRNQALRTFAKNLRRRNAFHASWEAVGGAQGLASLMAEFSVEDVRLLCSFLGQTAGAIYLRPERRGGLTELVQILVSGETDARPLRSFYQTIVPACETQFVKSWVPQTEWTRSQQKYLWLANRQQYEQQFLDDLFSERSKNDPDMFRQNTKLFRGNLPFCENILTRIASATSSKQFYLSPDFMQWFAMPLLKKLSGRRRQSRRSEYLKFLDLVVNCFKAHPQLLKSELRLNDGSGLIQFIVRAMIAAREDQDVFAAHLDVLLVLAPTKGVWVGDIYGALPLHGLTPQLRFDLIRIFLLHCQEYLVDIKNISLAAEKRILATTKNGKLWPARLFLSIPSNEGLALFEHLENVHQAQSFVSQGSLTNSVMCQVQNPLATELDLDIFRTVLQRENDHSSRIWVDGVQLALKERKKKASESREPRLRAFWAKSALQLCVAAGNLEVLQENLVWARRFVKDPLVGPDIFGPSVINTRELKALLVVVPSREALNNSRELAEVFSTVQGDIVLAGQILLGLLQTALSAIMEPSFKPNNWSSIVALPRNVAEGRVTNATGIMRVKTDVAEAKDLELNVAMSIWKPTIDSLLEIEALMSDPAAVKLASGGRPSVFTAGEFLAQIPAPGPSLLADLTTHYLDGMNSRLAPTLVKSHMRHIVAAVVRLAKSTQSSLAIPFVRPIIQNSDDSSSHRQLLTSRFLQSLPASTARHFVTTTASAIIDLMKEQNSRPWKEGVAPAVKVTTVKMMAQILEGNKVLAPKISCDILVSLLKEVRHIDARMAILSSLLSVLAESTSTADLRKHILDMFEEHVLTVASQLNERRPTTEEDWQQLVMPEVSTENSVLVWLQASARNGNLKREDRERLVRLSIIAVQQSAVHNERWVNLFVKRHASNIPIDGKVRAGPAHMGQLIGLFFAHFDFVPDSLIDTLQSVILNNVDPSPEMLQVTSTVKSDTKLAGSNAGQHWLAHFDSPGIKAISFGLTYVVTLLRTKRAFKSGDASIQRLQKLTTCVAERYIRLGDVQAISKLVERLTINTTRFDDKMEPDWRGRCMPILEDIIRMVEDKAKDQTSEVLLPNVFRLRLALLQVPLWQSERPIPEAVITLFAEELAELIDELVARRRPYHQDFEFLKEEINRSKKHFPENTRVGLVLARLREDWRQRDPSLAAYLRCELAATYLLSSSVREEKEEREEKGVKEDTVQLLQEWMASPVGDIRVIGVETRKALKEARGWFKDE